MVDKRVVLFGGLAGVGALILLMRGREGGSAAEPVAVFTEHAPTDAPRIAPVLKSPPRRNVTASAVLAPTNVRRAQGAVCGSSSMSPVPALSWNRDLAEAAQAHAEDMARRNYFDHVSPDGRTPSERIHAAGFTGRAVGENIASGQNTVESVMAAWMKSPGHCLNIMRPEYRYLGVGYFYSQQSVYGHYWVQCFGA